jgi:hypothetical protein
VGGFDNALVSGFVSGAGGLRRQAGFGSRSNQQAGWKEYLPGEGFAMGATHRCFATTMPTAAGNLEVRQYSVDLTKDSGC